MEVKVTRGPEVHCWGCGTYTRSEFDIQGEFESTGFRLWWCLDCLHKLKEKVDGEIQAIEKEIREGREGRA